MTVKNAFQTVAKASATKASATKASATKASATKASATKASTGAISPLVGRIVEWVDALPASVAFYRSAVSHHKGKGTVFPRKPLLGDKELAQAWDETKKRIADRTNANGFSSSKSVFDAYVVGKYGPGAIK